MTWIWAEAVEAKKKVRAAKKSKARFLATLGKTGAQPFARTDEKELARTGLEAGRRQAGAPVPLVGRGVVASLGVDRERRETLRRAELDLDFAPTGVVGVIARSVSEHILVTQLHADLGRDIRQIV